MECECCECFWRYRGSGEWALGLVRSRVACVRACARGGDFVVEARLKRKMVWATHRLRTRADDTWSVVPLSILSDYSPLDLSRLGLAGPSMRVLCFSNTVCGLAGRDLMWAEVGVTAKDNNALACRAAVTLGI